MLELVLSSVKGEEEEEEHGRANTEVMKGRCREGKG